MHTKEESVRSVYFCLLKNIHIENEFLQFVRYSEPSIRGNIMGCMGICGTLAMFMVYLLGSYLPWRQVALICFFVPTLSMLSSLLVSVEP